MPFRLHQINRERHLLNFWRGIAGDSPGWKQRPSLLRGRHCSPMVSGPGNTTEVPHPPCSRWAGPGVKLVRSAFLTNVDLESSMSPEWKHSWSPSLQRQSPVKTQSPGVTQPSGLPLQPVSSQGPSGRVPPLGTVGVCRCSNWKPLPNLVLSGEHLTQSPAGESRPEGDLTAALRAGSQPQRGPPGPLDPCVLGWGPCKQSPRQGFSYE